MAVKRRSMTLSLASLAAGLLLGALLHDSQHPLIVGLAAFIEPIGSLWVRALLLIALPLVATQLLATILKKQLQDDLGRLTITAFSLIIGFLVFAALFTSLSAPIALQWLNVERGGLPPITLAVPERAQQVAENGTAQSVAAWLVALIPTNPLKAALEEDILAFLVFIVLFGLAATQIPPASRKRLEDLAQATNQVLFILLHGALWFTEIAVFALSFAIAMQIGSSATVLLLQFAAVISILLIIYTVLLYPLTAVLAQISPRRFAAAVLPGQIVGATTRSSLAALPVLIEQGREFLRLKPGIVEFSIPLCGSIFKPNRTVSSTGKMLFLAHVYDIELSGLQIASFVVTVIILSFSGVGIPGGSRGFKTLPAYVAIGIPIEGYIFVEAVDPIPDLFKTVNNVTGYMSLTAILNRLAPNRTVTRGD